MNVGSLACIGIAYIVLGAMYIWWGQDIRPVPLIVAGVILVAMAAFCEGVKAQRKTNARRDRS